jgi:hypothetical protein
MRCLKRHLAPQVLPAAQRRIEINEPRVRAIAGCCALRSTLPVTGAMSCLRWGRAGRRRRLQRCFQQWEPRGGHRCPSCGHGGASRRAARTRERRSGGGPHSPLALASIVGARKDIERVLALVRRARFGQARAKVRPDGGPDPVFVPSGSARHLAQDTRSRARALAGAGSFGSPSGSWARHCRLVDDDQAQRHCR